MEYVPNQYPGMNSDLPKVTDVETRLSTLEEQLTGLTELLAQIHIAVYYHISEHEGESSEGTTNTLRNDEGNR